MIKLLFKSQIVGGMNNNSTILKNSMSIGINCCFQAHAKAAKLDIITLYTKN